MSKTPESDQSVLEIENLNFGFSKLSKSFYSHNSAKNLFTISGIDLTIKRGQSIGIIGRNGSGKSTLARIIAGVLIPDSGRVLRSTAVAPLIELGAGFDLELTAKENIYLYGLLVGIPYRELKNNYSSILKFSGLIDFENYPLRTYSSGMLARLAFAIVTSNSRGLILIDEALSVGDSEFSILSKKRIKSLIKNGAASIIISHDLQTVKSLTTKCVWLDSGKIREFDSTDIVVDKYTSNSILESGK
jgi:ABC-type polysaccharide/polyol phosphate transport system ATPase subunit